MFHNFRPIVLICCGLYAAVIFGLAGACSPEHYKADADKEVYNIIDNKWHDSFGQKANYTISDVPPAPNDIKIEKEIPPSDVLTLAQAVAVATAHNRDYQTQKENLYLAALDLTLERYNFARRWFGTIDAQYTKFTDQSGDNDEEIVAISEQGTQVGFSQLLADGAIVSANIAIDWVRFLTGDPRTSLGSVLSAGITQPLLRGAGRKIAQENLTQAERNALYQIRSFNRFREEFVVDIVTVYYSVLQRRDAVTNAENDYKRRIETKEMLEMKADAGRINRFQVDQAEQDVLRARDNYVRAQQRYEQLLDDFKISLALPTDANIQLDQNELKALEEIGIDEPDYTEDAAIETALMQRLDLANSMDRVDDAARKIIVAADALRAGLDITAGLNVDSTEKTDLDRLRFHEGTYSLGLSGDLPLDTKAQRNAYRQTLINLEQSQRRYDNDRDVVKFEVRDAYRRLLEAAERYRIQKTSLQLAEKRVESTALLLEAGRAITRDWLEAQDALIEAQNNLTDALVAHAIAKLSFFRDVGVLQVKPDGMWVQ